MNNDDEIWSTSIEADLFNSKNKQIVTDHSMYTIFKMLFSTHMKTGIIRKVLFWWPFSSDTCEQSYNPEEKKSVLQ